VNAKSSDAPVNVSAMEKNMKEMNLQENQMANWVQWEYFSVLEQEDTDEYKEKAHSAVTL